jgi:hypothetical protein
MTKSVRNKKSLILYQSITGNTEKVALRVKKVFEKMGWECDIFKVDKNTDVNYFPFDLKNYDFLCIGSGIYKHTCGAEIVDITLSAGLHPGKRTEASFKPDEHTLHNRIVRIVPGPKAGIVFVTYGGSHLGPMEAEPALATLALQMEHLKFDCIGEFSCPGKQADWGDQPTPGFWHGDISHRPSERDLLKAGIFMEEKIEELLIHRAQREMFGES